MCVICVCEKKKPSLSLIKEMAEANKDGIGISYIKDGVVHWKKGITEEQAYIISESVDAPLIMHFRIGTWGGTSKHLTHPFPVTSNVSLALEGTTKQGVLFHNGSWNDWQDRLWTIVTKGIKMPKGLWSDSRAIAWMVALYGRQVLALIPSQKIALLTPSGAEIYGHGWEEKDGMKFSNLYFENRGYNRDDVWDVDEKRWISKWEKERKDEKEKERQELKDEIIKALKEDKKDLVPIEDEVKKQIRACEDELELELIDRRKPKEMGYAY
jgi:hypothetical protein